MEWMRRWRPEIVVDRDSLKCPVRGLHVVETLDAAEMVRVGDVALSTGSMLADDGTIARRLARSLAENGAVALVLAVGPALEDASARSPRNADCEDWPWSLWTIRSVLPTSRSGRSGCWQVSKWMIWRCRRSCGRDSAGPSSGALPSVSCWNWPRSTAVARWFWKVRLDGQSQPRAVRCVRRSSSGFWCRYRGVSPPLGARTAGAPPDWIVADLGSDTQLWGRLVLCGVPRPRWRGVLLAERTSEALSMHRMLEHCVDTRFRRTLCRTAGFAARRAI